MWAHWSAQCVPEQGDWYARNMYIQGTPQSDYHRLHYGHPSRCGFKEIDHLWRAENWDPEGLVSRYRRGGAKYFMALANHHDNFDNWDSSHHAWNSVRIGPQRDLIAGWAAAARREKLPFGVSTHASHAWHWFQVAYSYDAEGDLAGVHYDGHTAPDLYCPPRMVPPDGIRSIAAMQDWHKTHDGKWYEDLPLGDPFIADWKARTIDLITKYQPDMIYFDDTGLPFGEAGLAVVEQLFATSRGLHGTNRAIATAKKLTSEQRRYLVEDYERGFSDQIQPLPWQTDTCIGDWHYKRDITYKTVGQVVRMLIDIVSKNGNLMLNIPVRGDGTIDTREEQFLDSLTAWMDVNGAGIFRTRPWRVFGEGPTRAGGGMFSEGRTQYTPQDVRFMALDQDLYAHCLDQPHEKLELHSLGRDRCEAIAAVALVGSDVPVRWKQTPAALELEAPERFPSKETAAFRVRMNA
jgi:alpha-L-fucosidase